MKMYCFIIIIGLMLFGSTISAQNDEMVNGSHKPKIWKRWRQREKHNATPFNPYLKKKKSDLPSAKQSKQNKRELRRQKRMARKQMKKNKKAYLSN